MCVALLPSVPERGGLGSACLGLVVALPAVPRLCACVGLVLGSFHHRTAGALAALCQHVMKPNQVVWLSFRKANGTFSSGAAG